MVFFGIFYALSGYMAAYSWNIMWLDCIVIFPLIMLALEHLVKEGKGMAYCLLLGFSILSNYYISIMTCMFLVFYMIALLILEQEMTLEKFVGRLFQFAGYSLLAGGLSAVVLLPEIFALQSTASGSSTFPQTFTQYFSIFDMLARHIGNVETEIGLDHWPKHLLRSRCDHAVFPLSGMSADPPEGKSGILCTFAFFPCEASRSMC
ncbi:MAG: YfhO family protein [Lachnospiraceae bacterium]